ncbi:hypothetical protein HYF36_005210 [Salmonella enterica]|nr:hypothetical protein [Salmonella enterica]EFR6717532.1 hypothetical protein [Salmonella enterica]
MALSLRFIEQFFIDLRATKDRITHQERKVINLYLRGKAVFEISLSLRISSKTVYVTMRNIIHKLGLKNRHELSLLCRGSSL